MIKLSNIVNIVFIAFFLSACTNVYLPSVPRLRQIDPLTTDFREVYGALKASETVQITSTPEFIFIVENFTTGETAERHFPLKAVKSGSVYQSFITEAQDDGFQIYVYKFSDETVVSLETFRNKASDAKAHGDKQKGTIGLQLRQFCIVESAEEAAKAQAYLRTIEIGEFLPLTKLLNVETFMADVGADPTICE